MRNSWTQHISLTYNQRYSFTLRSTWLCYESFGTIALGIYLFKEEYCLELYQRYFIYAFQESFQDGQIRFESEEFQLCVACMTFEFLPQALMLFTTGKMIIIRVQISDNVQFSVFHWHSTFDCVNLEFLREASSILDAF